MNQTTPRDLEQAQDEVSASSAGGAPFLIAYGLTLFITVILSFFIPINIVALVAMFQGSIALPLAFWLERRMGSGPMSSGNPLRPLSVQMAMSQILALPAIIVAYSLDPRLVPVVLAAVGGLISCLMPGCTAHNSTWPSLWQFRSAPLSFSCCYARSHFPIF